MSGAMLRCGVCGHNLPSIRARSMQDMTGIVRCTLEHLKGPFDAPTFNCCHQCAQEITGSWARAARALIKGQIKK